MPKEDIKIEQTRVFCRSFSSALQRKCKLTLISPFVTDFGPWTSILHFANFFINRQERPFTLITRPPSNSNGRLNRNDAARLASLGIDLKFRSKPPLHSKVYLFEYDDGDYTAFVGSANLTRGGFERNDESVAKIRTSSERSTIVTEIARLNGRGAFPFEYWVTMKQQNFEEGEIA